MRLRLFIWCLAICFMFSLGCKPAEKISYVDPIKGRLIQGATVHLGNGETLENAYIMIEKTIITAVSIEPPEVYVDDYELEQLSSAFHIYAFEKVIPGNSGIVLTRSDAESLNISIQLNQDEPAIQKGRTAQLIICAGSIENPQEFKVEYVITGDEKIRILRQSDYGIGEEE